MSLVEPRTARSSITIGAVGRAVLIGLGAALLAGLIAGLAARGLMRLATLAVGGEGEFSVAGTAMIAVFFGVAVVPGAVARALDARRTSVVLLVLGAGLVAFEAVSIASQDLAEAHIAGTTTIAIAAIGIGFVVAIVGLAWLAWRFASSWTAR